MKKSIVFNKRHLMVGLLSLYGLSACSRGSQQLTIDANTKHQSLFGQVNEGQSTDKQNNLTKSVLPAATNLSKKENINTKSWSWKNSFSWSWKNSLSSLYNTTSSSVNSFLSKRPDLLPQLVSMPIWIGFVFGASILCPLLGGAVGLAGVAIEGPAVFKALRPTPSKETSLALESSNVSITDKEDKKDKQTNVAGA